MPSRSCLTTARRSLTTTSSAEISWLRAVVRGVVNPRSEAIILSVLSSYSYGLDERTKTKSGDDPIESTRKLCKNFSKDVGNFSCGSSLTDSKTITLRGNWDGVHGGNCTVYGIGDVWNGAVDCSRGSCLIVIGWIRCDGTSRRVLKRKCQWDPLNDMYW